MTFEARTQEEIDECLMALVAWAGNAAAASRYLKSEKQISVSGGTLTEWARTTHGARYQELRDKFAEQLEGQLIADYREVAKLATEGMRLGIEKAIARLKSGKDPNPARTASDLATVADKNTRDMLSLSGRPTSIRQELGATEVIRSLMAKGILQLPEATVEQE